jgi:hypothetical protein
MIPQAVNVLAISPKCRWIKKDNDPDFRIIGDD